MEVVDFDSNLSLQIDRSDSVIILRIKGSISISDQYQVEQLTSKFIANGEKKMIFDLKNLNFIDSSGIGFFLKFYKELKKCSGKMALINLQPQVKNIMELALVNLLDELVCSSETEAIEKLENY